MAYGQGTVFGLPGMSLVIGHEPRAWNAGHQLRRNVGDQDDVSYVDALIDDLVALHRADPGRIYLVGLSNRGVLAHHFAARRPSRLAAMVAALASLTQLRHPPPACSLPVLVIHGARDEVIPLGGGMSRNALVRRSQQVPYLPVAEAVAFWARANGVSAEISPEVTETGPCFSTTYQGQAVTKYVLDGGATHGWPGGIPQGRLIAGGFSFEGTDLIWDFLKDKSRVPEIDYL